MNKCSLGHWAISLNYLDVWKNVKTVDTGLLWHNSYKVVIPARGPQTMFVVHLFSDIHCGTGG